MVKIKKNTDKNKLKKGTLDQRHTDFLDKVEKEQTSIILKKEKLQKYQLELKELLTLEPSKFTTKEINRKSQLYDNINRIKEEITNIQNHTIDLNYISNTLPILIDYYDNENVVDNGNEEDILNRKENSGKQNILSYFMKDVASTSPTEPAKPFVKPDNQPDQPTTQPYGKSPQKISKNKLYEKYLNITDINYKKKQLNEEKTSCSVDRCDGKMISNPNDGYLVCNKCGLTAPRLNLIDKPSYNEPTQDTGTYAYKRINHLTEILSQLQAKESTDIPAKVFESIYRELKKRKINKNELDIFRLRRILKKLNLRKYYEHVPHILQIINGKAPPNFSREDELKIKLMFKDIQKPFTLFCPKNRKNFLNYSYVLHKFCELLSLDDYITYFPLLKNHAKLLQHDRIWKNICEYMKWRYYKSI